MNNEETRLHRMIDIFKGVSNRAKNSKISTMFHNKAAELELKLRRKK